MKAKAVELEELTESVATSLTESLSRSLTVGVDAESDRHHYYRPANTVIVFDKSGIKHRQYLGEHTLAEWRQFVEQKRGWESIGQPTQIGEAIDQRSKQVKR